jgi:hypothetical protein
MCWTPQKAALFMDEDEEEGGGNGHVDVEDLEADESQVTDNVPYRAVNGDAHGGRG